MPTDVSMAGSGETQLRADTGKIITAVTDFEKRHPGALLFEKRT